MDPLLATAFATGLMALLGLIGLARIPGLMQTLAVATIAVLHHRHGIVSML